MLEESRVFSDVKSGGSMKSRVNFALEVESVDDVQAFGEGERVVVDDGARPRLPPNRVERRERSEVSHRNRASYKRGGEEDEKLSS